MSANLNNILKPKTKEDIINSIKYLSQEEKNDKLINVVRDCRLNIVKMLIEAGADINYKNEIGNTPLIIASIHNYLEIVKYLIEAGSDINIKNNSGDNALRAARYNNNSKIVKLLKNIL